MFGQRVAHGLLILSIASGLAVRLGFMEETVIAFRGLEWKFAKPVFMGDTVSLRVTVAEKKDMARLGGGLVIFKLEVMNQARRSCPDGAVGTALQGPGRGRGIDRAVCPTCGRCPRRQCPDHRDCAAWIPPSRTRCWCRCEAAGVCHSDLHTLQGEMRATPPLVLGHEGAGVVVEVGAEVASRATGRSCARQLDAGVRRLPAVSAGTGLPLPGSSPRHSALMPDGSTRLSTQEGCRLSTT